jgi:hypothetical protein
MSIVEEKFRVKLGSRAVFPTQTETQVIFIEMSTMLDKQPREGFFQYLEAISPRKASSNHIDPPSLNCDRVIKQAREIMLRHIVDYQVAERFRITSEKTTTSFKWAINERCFSQSIQRVLVTAVSMYGKAGPINEFISRRCLVSHSHKFLVYLQMPNNLPIKFFSSQTYQMKQMKLCCQCCSTNFQVSKKFVLFLGVMILHSLNLQQKYSRELQEKHFKDSKCHRHIQ